MSDPGLAIATQLAADVTLSSELTLGTNLFDGAVFSEPAKAVFCLAHGGIAPDDIVDNSGRSYNRPRVQIRVRDTQENFGSGQDLARRVRNAVHLKVPTGYIDCRAVESHPLYLGKDDYARHEWAINVELTIRE